MAVHTTTSLDGKVLEITLDRPKANAIDAATSRELSNAFVAFMADPVQRVAILTGGGEKFFSAGWDLGSAADGESFESDYGAGGFGGFPELKHRPKPIIVAAEHAQFFLPETRVGVLPDAGSIRLPRLLPRQLANEIIFGGRRLTADEAMSWGIVNKVAPSTELMDTARALAAEICLSAPLSVAAVLDIIRVTEDLNIADSYAAMRKNEAYIKAINSQDAMEGPNAFAEKRDPVWKGK